MKCLHPEDTQEIINRINIGELGIIPTDTIYGYACGVQFWDTKKRIFAAKIRDTKKEIGIIVNSISMLKSVVLITPEVEELLLNSQTSITVIGYKNPEFLFADYVSATPFVGVRITNSHFLQTVIQKTGPIFATSVNISGQPAINCVAELATLNADFLVDGGDLPADAKPSRIYNIVEQRWIR